MRRNTSMPCTTVATVARGTAATRYASAGNLRLAQQPRVGVLVSLLQAAGAQRQRWLFSLWSVTAGKCRGHLDEDVGALQVALDRQMTAKMKADFLPF